jgi:hypothetical protein
MDVGGFVVPIADAGQGSHTHVYYGISPREEELRLHAAQEKSQIKHPARYSTLNSK